MLGNPRSTKSDEFSSTFQTAFYGFLGLAQVQHHPVVARPVLEDLSKTPTATHSVVVSYQYSALFSSSRRREQGKTYLVYLCLVISFKTWMLTPPCSENFQRFMVDGAPGLSGGLARASFRRKLTLAATETQFKFKEAKE